MEITEVQLWRYLRTLRRSLYAFAASFLSPSAIHAYRRYIYIYI